MGDPAIAYLPYMEGLRRDFWNISLDRLKFPLGRPERLKGDKQIKHMSVEDHLIVYPRSVYFFMPKLFWKVQISVMIVEPNAVHTRYLKRAQAKHGKFFRILSRNAELLREIPNGIHFPFGGTFIKDIEAVSPTKSKNCSLIASAKRVMEGHSVRHVVADAVKNQDLNVDLMGRGYLPFDDKEDGLAPYRYSVIIENIQEESYFTEKLVDCLLCKTIPIYWGAPNIGEYFDVDGMIICNNADEILEAIKTLPNSIPRMYQAAIKQNYQKAFYYANISDRAARMIDAEIKTAS